MTDTGPTATAWTCPRCSRRVPLRIEACRCGEARPSGGTAPFAAATRAATPVPAAAPAAAPAVALPGPLRTRTGFDERLRSPKEGTLFVIGVALSGLFWLLLVLSIVGILYGAVGLLLGLVVHALFLGYVRGNALRVSARQLPDVHAAVLRSAQALGLEREPEVYVLQAEGALNAFATRLLSRNFVIVYSDLVDACADPRQLEFVIGHEVGHLAAGHLKWNAFLWPFALVPLLGSAYSRAREYTCDRCGLAVIGDLEASLRGLIVLAAGGRQAARADIGAFSEQRLETGRLWSAVAELGSTHPFLCKRVAALEEHVRPGSRAPVARNPFAYVLAPFFGFGGMAGGGLASLLMMVAVVGMIAAIAIPALLRARMAANQAAAAADAFAVVKAEDEYSRAAGRYGTLECLEQPAACLPGYPGPSLLSGSAAKPEARGYSRVLLLTSDQTEFAYVATPLQPGQTGISALCADSSGFVCATTEIPVRLSSPSCRIPGCEPVRSIG